MTSGGTCPVCRHEVLAGATACTRCGASLAAVGPPLPPPPGGSGWAAGPAPAPAQATGVLAPPLARRPGMPSVPPWPAPTSAPAPAARQPWVPLLAGVLVLGLAAFVGWRLLSGGRFPDEIAGYPRNTSEIGETMADLVRQAASAGGLDVEVAIYGEGFEPAFLVVLIDDAPALSADAFFEGAAAGFAGTSGVPVDTAAQVTATRGDSRYLCAPVRDAGTGGALCVWSEEGTVGMVVSMLGDDVTGAMTLTQQVDDAVG